MVATSYHGQIRNMFYDILCLSRPCSYGQSKPAGTPFDHTADTFAFSPSFYIFEPFKAFKPLCRSMPVLMTYFMYLMGCQAFEGFESECDSEVPSPGFLPRHGTAIDTMTFNSIPLGKIGCRWDELTSGWEGGDRA